MNCSKPAPSFGIVRKCFMVSPQEGQIRTGMLSGTSGELRWRGLRACDPAWRNQLKQAERYRTLSHRRLARGRCR
jgi:hypothetical protein